MIDYQYVKTPIPVFDVNGDCARYKFYSITLPFFAAVALNSMLYSADRSRLLSGDVAIRIFIWKPIRIYTP